MIWASVCVLQSVDAGGEETELVKKLSVFLRERTVTYVVLRFSVGGGRGEVRDVHYLWDVEYRVRVLLVPHPSIALKLKWKHNTLLTPSNLPALQDDMALYSIPFLYLFCTRGYDLAIPGTFNTSPQPPSPSTHLTLVSLSLSLFSTLSLFSLSSQTISTIFLDLPKPHLRLQLTRT